MKQKYFIPIITTLAFTGLILIQIDWLQKVWETEKQTLENQLPAIYKTSANIIYKKYPSAFVSMRNLPVNLEDCKLPNEKEKISKEEEWLSPILEEVFEETFGAINVEIDYEYAVYRHSGGESAARVYKKMLMWKLKNDSTLTVFNRKSFKQELATPFYEGLYILCSDSSLLDEVMTSSYRQENWLLKAHDDFHPTKDQALSLALYFPKLNQYLLKKIFPQITTALALFILLLGCFLYTLINLQRHRKLSEMKNDFINNLTHEFKTPLFSISLASEVLRNNETIKASEKLVGYVDLIDEENQRLKEHIERVLELVSLDEGKFEMAYQHTDMHKLIEKVVNSFELIIQNRNGHLDLILEAVDPALSVDPLHISQVIYNLIDNAIKYSPEAPEILVQTEDTEEAFIIRIEDHGMGIKPKDLKRIFEKFYRVSEGDLHQVKGFGLGLHYSKRMIEAHGGEMELRSIWGEGTTVEIVLFKRL